MMQTFDILNRHTSIHHHLLVEASAGTGKTFTIQHLVARLLMESPAIPLEQILVVTFTKAAAQDLKQRIRKTLDQLCSGEIVPDYLEDKQMLKRLERAKTVFDEAQICTIHSFCARTLREFAIEANVGAQFNGKEEHLSLDLLHTVIQDTFLTRLDPTCVTPGQIKILLKKYKNNTAKLHEKIAEAIRKPYLIQEPLSAYQLQVQIADTLKSMSYDADLLYEDFLNQLPYYKKKDFSDIENKLKIFAQLSPQVIEEGLLPLEFFDPANRDMRKKYPENLKLHYPDFCQELKEKFAVIIEQFRSPLFIFAKIAHLAQRFLRGYLEEHDLLDCDKLLSHTLKATQNPAFIHSVSKKYKAVIIDEFQDTDPQQWEIFEKLFSSTSTHLYLVGDPKQSIYSFRQADIYTYLRAAQVLGKEHQVSLNTNYRSQPALIDALNVLFSAPGWLALPRLEAFLPYHPVQSAIPIRSFMDEKNALHFLISKEDKDEDLFPTIIQEIIRLYEKENIPLENMAILVKDRIQADRFYTACRQAELPALLQRTSSLVDSPLVQSLIEILQATLFPKNESKFRTALGNRIIGWTSDQFSLLEDLFYTEKIMAKWINLRKLLLKEGFAPFFQEFLTTAFHPDGFTVGERLNTQNYHTLVQIAELLMQYQFEKCATASKLILYLQELMENANPEDEELKVRQDPLEKGIRIMTLHISKGLEFDIVFTLGLINRTTLREELIPVQEHLQALLNDDPLRKQFLKEVDAEKMRQLYVAMTRAKYRLYVPVLLPQLEEVPQLGIASPLELLMSYHGKEILFSSHFSHQFVSSKEIPTFCRTSAALTLLPPPKVCVDGLPLFMHSYSSMHKIGPHEDSMRAPHDFSIAEKTLFTLPAGSETGERVHQVIEKIAFSTPAQVHHYLQGSAYQEWGAVIEEMLSATFALPLPGLTNFSLAALAEHDCFREMEFTFPWKDGYLKGVIDLVFQHQGKYYIVDWKTNWLGPSQEYYTPFHLQAEMERSDYYLQAQIYTEAWKRYLSVFDQRPFDSIFGGVFYFFLRGKTLYQIPKEDLCLSR